MIDMDYQAASQGYTARELGNIFHEPTAEAMWLHELILEHGIHAEFLGSRDIRAKSWDDSVKLAKLAGMKPQVETCVYRVDNTSPSRRRSNRHEIRSEIIWKYPIASKSSIRWQDNSILCFFTKNHNEMPVS